MMNLSTAKNPPLTPKPPIISPPIDNTLNPPPISKLFQVYPQKRHAANILTKISFTFVSLAKFNAFVQNASFMVFLNLFRKT
jgi:hypothetical protein